MQNRIYFLKSGSRIKIGVTRNLRQRVTDIGKHLAKKPVLMGSIVGSYALEKQIHSELNAHLIRNEWFRDCDEVRKVMSRVLSGDYVAIEPPRPVVKPAYMPLKRTPEEWLDMVNRVAGVMWPNDAAIGFADMVEEARAILVGEQEFPRPLQCVMAVEVVAYCMS